MNLCSAIRRSVHGIVATALMTTLVAGCSPHPPESPDPSDSAVPSPTPPPVVSSEDILQPHAWTLLPGETPVHEHAGQEPAEIGIPVSGIGAVYVMYATCDGGSTLAVEITGATDRGDDSWDIACDSVPHRREVHTTEDTRTAALDLTMEGEGAWGFVLATVAGG